MSVLRRLRRGLNSKITQPDYAGLTNVVFHGRWDGLVSNTDNDFGTVNSSSELTLWKSAPPFATGVDFGAGGIPPTLGSDGVVFATSRLRHGPASPISSAFNNFHYRATLTDLKWTAHGVIKIGTSSNPDAIYGIFGNNGGATANKGIACLFDDRSAQFFNNQFRATITRGSGGQYNIFGANMNIIEPNKWLDFWLEVDKSLEREDQVKLYLNGFRFILSNEFTTDTLITGASYNMEIGAVGNNVSPATMTLKEITFMDGVMSDSFRQTFVTNRMFKYGIAAFPSQIDGITLSSNWDLYDTLSESRYYLANLLCQNPTDEDVIVSIFSDGTSHVYEVDKKISFRRSLDKGRTWGSKGLVFDPTTGNQATQGIAAGYGSSGRLHVGCCVHSSFTVGANHYIYHGYSDDDGDNWTFTDITSSVPSDGLNSWRVYGRVIENSGRLMFTYYKFADENSLTTSARYLMVSDDGGSTWSSILIESGASYRNECEVVALSADDLLVITRDEVDTRWYQSVSDDNGDTWTNQGVVTFGEAAYARSAPVRLHKFQILGTDVIACYYNDRDKDLFKVNYAKASDIISSGISAWAAALKFTIHQGSDEHLHYGDVCHYDDNFKAFGMSVIDPFPPAGSGTENVMYTFDIPTFHYPFIKSALGL